MAEAEMTIGNETYPVTYGDVEQESLLFFIDNPRVYSLFDRSVSCPSQEEMEDELCKCDDVRQLRDSIEANGGLIQPVVIHKNVVIEGNRRLAAYRMLFKKDKEKWAKISVVILPDYVPDSAILIYLGQIHIMGQKDWAPFEQAGFLYRSMGTANVSIKELAETTGLSSNKVKSLVNVYELMINNDDQESKHWSYYEEYLKNKAVKKIREVNPDLDAKVSLEIKAGVITDAKKDIRERLGAICKSSKAQELIEDYIDNKKTLRECFDEIDENDADVKKALELFRKKVLSPDFKSTIIYSTGEERESFKHDLSVIQNTVDYILKMMI